MASTARIEVSAAKAASRPRWAKRTFGVVAVLCALLALAFGLLTATLVVSSILMAAGDPCPPPETSCESMARGFAGPVFVAALVLLVPTLVLSQLTRRAWRAAKGRPRPERPLFGFLVGPPPPPR